MISPSVGESEKAKGWLSSGSFVKTSNWMGQRLAEALSHSGSPSPAEGGGGHCLTGAPQHGQVTIRKGLDRPVNRIQPGWDWLRPLTGKVFV